MIGGDLGTEYSNRVGGDNVAQPLKEGRDDMITGIDVNDTKPYVLKDDKGDNPTTFYIGLLNKRDFFKLLHDVLDKDGNPDIKAIHERSGDIVKKGVKRIENYALNSKVEAMNYQTIDDNIIESLPTPALVELATQIITINFLGGDDQKN